MVCEHLRALDEELTAAGIPVDYRERQPRACHCRAWTRFSRYLDLNSIRARMNFPACVEEHEWNDIWTGNERGFVCTVHDDAVIGDYAIDPARPVIR